MKEKLFVEINYVHCPSSKEGTNGYPQKVDLKVYNSQRREIRNHYCSEITLNEYFKLVGEKGKKLPSTPLPITSGDTLKSLEEKFSGRIGRNLLVRLWRSNDVRFGICDDPVKIMHHPYFAADNEEEFGDIQVWGRG